MFYWKCRLNALVSYESILIEILMLTLRGLDLGVPSSYHLMKLALSGRDMPLFQDRPSASLIGSLDRGGGCVKGDWCDSVNSVMEWNPDRGPGFA